MGDDGEGAAPVGGHLGELVRHPGLLKSACCGGSRDRVARRGPRWFPAQRMTGARRATGFFATRGNRAGMWADYLNRARTGVAPRERSRVCLYVEFLEFPDAPSCVVRCAGRGGPVGDSLRWR
ncbi:hypothetical protein GCM10010219_25420 [Streptomyces netropsis]|nr:hypothetical protein GCM10010219_25420 [Streptomyces netropsis]